MLRRDLGVDVELEAGPYGSFQLRDGEQVLVDGGRLAFVGILPSMAEIRDRVQRHQATTNR